MASAVTVSRGTLPKVLRALGSRFRDAASQRRGPIGQCVVIAPAAMTGCEPGRVERSRSSGIRPASCVAVLMKCVSPARPDRVGCR